MHQKQISSTKLDTEKRIVLETNDRVQGLNSDKQQTTGVTSQISHSSLNTTRNTNYEELQSINTAIYVAKEYSKKSKDKNEKSKKSFDEAPTHFEQFRI